MATTLADSATLAADPAFVARITAAFCVVGTGIIANEPYDPQDPDSGVTLARRALYINAMQQGIDNPVRAMAWSVAAQSTITTDSTDEDITTAVTTLWSAVAGA